MLLSEVYMSYPSYLIHFNPNHDPKTGRFTDSKGRSYDRKYVNLDGSLTKEGEEKNRKMVEFGKSYGTHVRVVEDMSTALTRNVKPGTQILVPKDTKDAFIKAIDNYEKVYEFAHEHYYDPVSKLVKMDDGYKYIFTSITSKDTGMTYERFDLLNEQDNKRNFTDLSNEKDITDYIKKNFKEF